MEPGGAQLRLEQQPKPNLTRWGCAGTVAPRSPEKGLSASTTTLATGPPEASQGWDEWRSRKCHAATRRLSVGAVSGQTRPRCSAGRSPCGCPHVRLCGPFPVCVPVGRCGEAWPKRGPPRSSSQCPPRCHCRRGCARGSSGRRFIIGVGPPKLSATIEVVDPSREMARGGVMSTIIPLVGPSGSNSDERRRTRWRARLESVK